MSAKEDRKDTCSVAATPYPAATETHGDDDGDLGSVQIHNGVIAVIARSAAVRVPGVVDLIGNLVDGLAGIMGRKSGDRGVHVELADNCVIIELSVVLEYGVSIPKTAWQIQHDVREAVESMTGKAVKAVNVLVQSVHLPPLPKQEKAKTEPHAGRETS